MYPSFLGFVRSEESKFHFYRLLDKMGGRRNRIARLERELSKSVRDRDDRISISPAGTGMEKEEEVSRLRHLNQLLINYIKSSRQEKGFYSQELTQVESPAYNLEGKFDLKLDNLHGELTEKAKVREQGLEEVEREFREQCQRKIEEFRADFSSKLQDAEERFRKEIFEKEEECRELVADKMFLESSVLKLNGEIQVISAQLEAVRESWKFEKEELLAQILAARQETEEVKKESQMAEQAWNTEKHKFLSSLAAYKEKIEEMSMENERLLVQSMAEKIEMQSRFNEIKANAQELLELKHVWVFEKRNLESNVAELQRKLDSSASERELLSQKNRELSTQIECLEAQLNEHIATLAHLDDENGQHERVLNQWRTEVIELQSKLNESQDRVQVLLTRIEQDGHLWDEKQRNLEAKIAELKISKESMGQKIMELIIEVEFLKTLENEQEAALVSMEEEKQVLEEETVSNEKRLQYLLTKIALTEGEINGLQQQLNELGFKQLLDLIKRYNATERALQRFNDIQQKDLDATKRLLETQNQRVAVLEAALYSVDTDLESKKRRSLHVVSKQAKWFAKILEIKLCA